MKSKREIIIAAGSAAFGSNWQTDLSRELNINIRSVRRWVSGDSEPRDTVYNDILDILNDRIDIIQNAIELIKKSKLGDTQMNTKTNKEILDDIIITHQMELAFHSLDERSYESFGSYMSYPVIIRAEIDENDIATMDEEGCEDCIDWDDRVTSINLIDPDTYFGSKVSWEYDVEKAIKETGLELDNK